jgi:hypothetical protein
VVRQVFKSLADEAHAGMKWFRSNLKHGSRLALCALAIQFLLSFGHFHGSGAQAAPALADAKQSGFHHTVGFAATHLAALDRASLEAASGPVRLKTVMALANAMVIAAPVYLPGPQAFAFLYLTTDAEFVDLNSARVAFQPRAPPIS